MELARAWAALSVKPRRSALFLSVTAEEGGLKGSEYYATHPLIPAAQTAIDLNYDALFPWGRAKDVVITGAERTTVWPLAQQIAARLNLEVSPDDTSGAGPLFPLGPFFLRARRHSGIFHRPRHGVRRQAGRLRPPDVARVQHESLPSSVGRVSGRLGFHGAGASGRIRIHLRPRYRERGEVTGLASGRSISQVGRIRNRPVVGAPCAKFTD